MGGPTINVLEIGGTHVTAASVHLSTWEVRRRTRYGLDSGAPAPQILATLISSAQQLADTVPTAWAVAVPDPFDYAHGIALFRDVGKFDSLYGIDLRHAFAAAIRPEPLAITFVHDTEAFVLGEWLCGAAVGADRCIGLTIGTGIGSAFLDRGRQVRGGVGLPSGGRLHRQLLDGLPLEEIVSRRAIRRRYAGATGDIAADVEQIADRARHGDSVAGTVMEEAFGALGRALAPAIEGFAPEVLVVGGGISHSWDIIAAPLAAALADCGLSGVDARPARRTVDAPLIGAARRALASTSEVVA